MLASIIDNTSERSGRWQMYATIYRNELWSRSPTVKHHPHKCSLQRVQISLQLPVHRATNRAAAVAWRCRGCYRKNRSPLYIAWDQVRSLCNGILALEVSYQVSYLFLQFFNLFIFQSEGSLLPCLCLSYCLNPLLLILDKIAINFIKKPFLFCAFLNLCFQLLDFYAHSFLNSSSNFFISFLFVF